LLPARSPLAAVLIDFGLAWGQIRNDRRRACQSVVDIVMRMADPPMDAFFEFATEFADGERWKLLRSEGWDDFVERLAHAVGDLPPRRRQALMMLLFAMIEEFASPEEVRVWLDEHDVATDAGVDALITWLRQRRSDRPD
jgi:hypothetical protein